jgi:hypothetical protein
MAGFAFGAAVQGLLDYALLICAQPWAAGHAEPEPPTTIFSFSF